jgi:spermidine/putrescine transport system permease protein
VSTLAQEGTTLSAKDIAPPKRERSRGWTYYVLPLYSAVFFLYLLIPIAFMIIYSFNQSPSALPQVTAKWQGFTTEWYRQWNGIPGLGDAFFLSIKLALLSTVISAILGTLLALALVRYFFRGKAVTEQVMFTNIAAPEIVLGASLLGFFITINLDRGFQTLLIAHVMFCVAYVTITVRARLSGFDPMLEQAAQDLGATPWVTFWKVTLPLIFPGILAGALLAFALSIDDFVTSNFVSGQTVTFPLWVYGAVKIGVPPQVFVLGTAIFAAGLTLAVIALVFQGRARKIQATEDADEAAA